MEPDIGQRCSKEGTLGGNRVHKPRSHRPSIVSMLMDAADPQFYPPLFYVACGEEIAPNTHERVYAIKGKAASVLTLEDVGRPVRVTGVLRSRHPRYGEFTRAKVEFLDGE